MTTTAADTSPALQVSGLCKSFMGVAALQDVEFTLRAGSVLGLIGPNGSGKSTALDCITGFVRPDRGTIMLNGQPIFGDQPHTIARKGVARSFQNVRLYDELSLEDHLELGLRCRRDRALGRRSKLRSDDLDRAASWLTEFGLYRLRSAPAGILSYGQKKLLALAAVLVAQPAIAMLDEPLAGVNPIVIDVIRQAITDANAMGQTFLIIEHNVEFVTSCCAEVVVLEAGRKLAAGPPTVIWENAEVYEAFLGRKADNDES